MRFDHSASSLSLPEAFPVWFSRPSSLSFGLRAEETAAGDWFVLAHLGFLFLLLGCFGWAAWSIRRRIRHPQPHLKLLMELEEEAAAQPAPEAAEDSQPAPAWERPADWWKRG